MSASGSPPPWQDNMFRQFLNPPNWFTAASMFCGMYAIVLAVGLNGETNFYRAGLMILFAGVFKLYTLGRVLGTLYTSISLSGSYLVLAEPFILGPEILLNPLLFGGWALVRYGARAPRGLASKWTSTAARKRPAAGEVPAPPLATLYSFCTLSRRVSVCFADRWPTAY